MTRASLASMRCFAFVLLCGATIAPVGDHFHVAQGVTEYLTDFGPIWLGNSPLWFVLLVAPFMAVLAVGQGRWRASRGETPVSASAIFLSPLLLLALYLGTSFYPLREGGSLEALVTLSALAIFGAFDRTRSGFLVASAAAVFATSFECALVHLGVFRYLPESDELLGVAPWLLPLYFAASIAVGAVGRRFCGGSPGHPRFSS